MAVVTLDSSNARATAAAITRWMRMIELHGGPAPALEALLRDVERLERLQRALRNCGLDPDMLLQEEGSGSRPR